MKAGAEERDKIYWVDDDGVLAGSLRWVDGLFGDKRHWGQTRKVGQEIIHVIDIDKISRDLRKSFDGILSQYSRQVSDQIERRLNEKKENFFNHFKAQIENIRSDLLQVQRDRRRDEEEQEALRAALRKLKKKARGCYADSQQLHNEVDHIKISMSDGTPEKLHEQYR